VCCRIEQVMMNICTELLGLFQALNVFSNKLTILIAGYARGNHFDEMQEILNEEIDKLKSK
jgi:hypothetical protein